MAIFKTPMGGYYKNHSTLVPCNFTEGLIYLINNTLQYDYLVLSIIDYPYPAEDYYAKEPQGVNNKYA